MIKIIISFKKNVIKIFLFTIFIFPMMVFLNTGLLIDPYWKVIQAGFFTLVITAAIIWPGLKKNIFWLGLILVIIMAFLYIASFIDVADMIGSTGVGLIMINLLSYLPQLVKLGYIKKL